MVWYNKKKKSRQTDAQSGRLHAYCATFKEEEISDSEG